LVLATTNRGKAAEFKRIFEGHEVLAASELKLDFHYREDGSTFLENAMGKAKTLFHVAGEPVLADDSGLSVPALGGEPGVLTARYGSVGEETGMSDADRYRYLLARMKGIQDRRAFFTCCMVLLIGEERFFVVQETLWGLIAEKPAGTGGFGYDPVFYVPEYAKTIAELPDNVKDAISHRGKTGRRMLTLLATLSEAE